MNKKLNVVDLFAGAGGFGLGFTLTNNFDLIFSLEIDDWAYETIEANKNKNHEILKADIRDFYNYDTIRNQFSKKPNIVIGGPPCQGFSIAGPAKDPNDPRNSLFMDFARWIKYIEPDIFVMENVKGIMNRRNSNGEKVIQIIKNQFTELGYYVDIWKLNAANYGVPQNRERVFFVGNRFNNPIDPPKDKFSNINYDTKNNPDYISVWEAISDLPEIFAGEGTEQQNYQQSPENEFQRWCRSNSNFVYNHIAMNHTARVINRFKLIIEGKNLKKIPKKYRVRKRNGNGEVSSTEYNSNYRHLSPDKISYTIPASFYSNFVHPFSPRNITAREAARIQSFPDNYIFKGKRTQVSQKLLKKLGKENEDHLSQYNQIGNAVPPLLGMTIANTLFEFLS